MGRTKCKVDYMMEYADDIRLLRDGLSLRKVRSKTGRALNTLRKLRRLFTYTIKGKEKTSFKPLIYTIKSVFSRYYYSNYKERKIWQRRKKLI